MNNLVSRHKQGRVAPTDFALEAPLRRPGNLINCFNFRC